MTYDFNFTTRDSWLAYRADWRARYKAQSESIRQTKRMMVQARLAGGSSDGYQSTLHYQRREANRLMLELSAAKDHKNALLAQRQPVEA